MNCMRSLRKLLKGTSREIDRSLQLAGFEGSADPDVPLSEKRLLCVVAITLFWHSPQLLLLLVLTGGGVFVSVFVQGQAIPAVRSGVP